MDANRAAEELKAAHEASGAGAIPRLPRWVPITAGFLVAAAITLMGWASAGAGWRLAEVAGGVLLAGAAVLVVRDARRRHGIRGLRGAARQEWMACLVVALAFVVIALGATAQERAIYAGLGVVGGAATVVLLYRRGS
jgi:hypothetical protein